MAIQNYNDSLSSYFEQIDMLFDILDGDLPNTNSKLASASKTSLVPYDEEADVQRAPAPRATKCFSGCGWRGGGGRTAVDILNSVNNLTTNIITSSAQAASVIVPPLANALENIVVQWLNPAQTPQTPQQPKVIPPTQPGGQGSPGQWVWVQPGGQQPPGQWIAPGGQQPPGGQGSPGQWVPPGGQQPPGQWLPPGGQQPPGQWMPPGGQGSPGQWIPPGGQQPPGQWVPPGGQQPPGQRVPQGGQVPPGQWMPPGGQQQPGQWTPPGGQQPQGNWGNYPQKNQYQNQGYPPAPEVSVQVNATDKSTANVSVGFPRASPSPTRSAKPQNITSASAPLTRGGIQNVPQPYSPDLHPAVQKCSQEINKILQDMDKCLDGIMVKLS